MTPGEPDPHLVDDALAEEIELVTRLVLAAAKTDAPLGQAEIDRLLGVREPADDEEGATPVG